MVFQNYTLYPHLSVADNIAFGLRLRKMPKQEVDRRILWAAKMLDLSSYLDRKPKQLSGGQRQRVAMGRAIVRQPKVFLMDEPLSNLDAKLRGQMRGEISRLQHDLGTTTVYVTHDQVEAMTMGHRVAVMNFGVLQQIDTPQRLYDEPANVFVAGFIGTPPMNLLVGRVEVEHAVVTLVLGEQRFEVPSAALERYPMLVGYAGGPVVVGARSDDLHATETHPELPSLTARLLNFEALGSETICYFRIDVPTLGRVEVEEELAVTDAESIVAAQPNFIASFPPRVSLRIDEDVAVAVDVARLHFFDEETGAALR
jgi:multiple sugar transport system ATP-binding protein